MASVIAPSAPRTIIPLDVASLVDSSRLDELLDAVLSAALRGLGNARIKGAFITFVSCRFDEALNRRGLAVPGKVSKRVQVAEAKSDAPAEDILAVLQDSQDVPLTDSATKTSTTTPSFSTEDGADLRMSFKSEVADLSAGEYDGVGPIPPRVWRKLDAETAEAIRKRWLLSEFMDWRTAVAPKIPADAVGQYAALADGHLVGLYRTSEAATSASVSAIRSAAGPIGVGFIRLVSCLLSKEYPSVAT